MHEDGWEPGDEAQEPPVNEGGVPGFWDEPPLIDNPQPLEPAAPVGQEPPDPRAARRARSRKILTVLGAIFLILSLTVCACTITLFVQGSGLDKESRSFANEAIPAIFTDWDPEQIRERASAEFDAVSSYEELNEMFAAFDEKLGALKSYEITQGNSNVQYRVPDGKIVTAGYVAHAEFEAGPAELSLSLIKHEGEWQILGFNINSKALIGIE